MIMQSARKLIDRWCLTPPSVGTGPSGSKNGQNWISAKDVIVNNSMCFPENATSKKYFSELRFSHLDSLPLRDYQSNACDA